MKESQLNWILRVYGIDPEEYRDKQKRFQLLERIANGEFDPPKKRKAKWNSDTGLSLVEDLERYRRDLGQDGKLASIPKSIRALQQDGHWSGYDPDVLRVRYNDSRKAWTDWARFKAGLKKRGFDF